MTDRAVEAVMPDRDGFGAQLLRMIGTLRTEDIAGIGIGLPGRIDGARGEILSAGYLDIAGLDLPGLVLRETGLTTAIENDATMALLGEARGTDETCTVMITIGTGIGGAILRHGRPWHGGGIAGQFGHLVVAADGPLCKCGRRGCVETFAAGPALGAAIADAGLPAETDANDLLTRAAAGEATAEAILRGWADPLGRAIDTIVAAFDPTRILIGGGL
ncbi:MAG: ROK family protein, partial [Pseudomonadota bacterium]